jgi:hypothetical protein
MRNELSWNQQQENIKAAKTFAAFLDLRAVEIAEFRRKHPDFIHILLWNCWESIQKQFQKVWENGFSQREALQVLSSNDFMGGKLDELITTTIDEQGKTHEKRQSVEQYQQGLTYKKAVLFLFTDSWRAKVCERCERHFIRNHSQTKCCSVQCSSTRRKQYKAERHTRVKEKLNAKRRREYARRQKKYADEKRQRRSHAKRENIRQG